MRIIKPREELQQYVRYYWIMERNEPFSVLTFPIGCPQIIFHRKNTLFIPETGNEQSNFTISGQVNFPAHICSDGYLEMIVAVFYPHTIGMFIKTPPSAFYNLEISGYDLENRQLTELAQRIFDCKNQDECINLLDNWLFTRINPSLNIMRIKNSLVALLSEPGQTVKMLAETTCLGKRQFERVFRDTVGMNPKEYARIVRFQKALWLMQTGENNYAGIASECGYADQSHFIREFKTMSGHTPSSLLACCRPYSDLLTNPV